MRFFLLCALVLFVFALIVALGATFVTTWNVWLIAGFIAWVLDQLTGGYVLHGLVAQPRA